MDRNQIAKQRAIQRAQLNKAGKLMQDSLGKQVKVGQVVDLPLNGMYRGFVVQVNESVIARPGTPPQPPHILIQVVIPKTVGDTVGNIPFLYIVQDAPQEVESEPKPTSPIIQAVD